jgi:hypothetical protein
LQLKPTTVPSCSFQSSTAWCTHLAIFASSSTFFPSKADILLSFPKQVYLYGALTPFKGLHLWAAWFCLSPGLHPTLGALGRMSLHLSSTCLSHLSATLGALGRMSLQFTLISHTRLPYLSFTLISHSGYLGPHEFSLVFHVFPILVFHCGRLGSHDFRFVSHLFPILIFHTCLLVWVPWAA